MQKWEYLQLKLFTDYGEVRYAVNGQFKHEWNNQAFHAILNNLGDQGWELVTEEAREYLFKRAKGE